jgi:hypothetical protein
MATFLWDGKARQENDPKVRRPACMENDALNSAESNRGSLKDEKRHPWIGLKESMDFLLRGT